MRLRNKFFLLALLLSFSFGRSVFADAAKDLFQTGQKLDAMVNTLTEQAERECYWKKGGGRDHPCMQGFAGRYNREYGEGSFTFDPQLNILHYTGLHYEKIVKEHPKSRFAAGAEFQLLRRNVIGLPGEVLPRIEEFLKKNTRGEWWRHGVLLLARINQDIWYIHKYRSWVLYNWKISDAELALKAEQYRAEALKHFEILMKKHGTTPEGAAARKEYDLLKKHQDDGKLHGIVDEAG